MNNMNTPTNIVLAGLGGQGVIRAADILAEAAFIAGCDVKQSEIHGMSQRGGSVSSDVRFGKFVLSPMVPMGEADFLLVLHPTQVDNNLYQLKEGGVLISTRDIIGEGGDVAVLDSDPTPLSSRNFNVGLLGLLSSHLPLSDESWHEAVRRHLPKRVHDENIAAFAYGKTLRGD
jgi:indolepyruvate ferredoxin oxidoreductase beta subunit